MPRGRPRKNPLAEPTEPEMTEIEETLEQLPKVAADPEKYPCTIAEDVAISILLRGSGHPDYLAGLHASLSEGALGKLQVLLDKQGKAQAEAQVNTHLPLPDYDLGPMSLL